MVGRTTQRPRDLSSRDIWPERRKAIIFLAALGLELFFFQAAFLDLFPPCRFLQHQARKSRKARIMAECADTESGVLYVVDGIQERLQAYEVPLIQVPPPRTPSAAADLVLRSLVSTPADRPTSSAGRELLCNLCPNEQDVILLMPENFSEAMYITVLHHMLSKHHDNIMSLPAFKRCWEESDKVSLNLLLQGGSYYALDLLSCVVVQPTNRRPFHSFVAVC